MRRAVAASGEMAHSATAEASPQRPVGYFPNRLSADVARAHVLEHGTGRSLPDMRGQFWTQTRRRRSSNILPGLARPAADARGRQRLRIENGSDAVAAWQHAGAVDARWRRLEHEIVEERPFVELHLKPVKISGPLRKHADCGRGRSARSDCEARTRRHGETSLPRVASSHAVRRHI